MQEPATTTETAVSIPVRIWTKTLRKLDHLCKVDERKQRAAELDFLLNKELRSRSIDPETLAASN